MGKRWFSHYLPKFAPGLGRDLAYAAVASVALWLIIFLYLANYQGLQVFRYVMF
jgi:hypothetical protein